MVESSISMTTTNECTQQKGTVDREEKEEAAALEGEVTIWDAERVGGAGWRRGLAAHWTTAASRNLT